MLTREQRKYLPFFSQERGFFTEFATIPVVSGKCVYYDNNMSATSVQFSVAVHMMAALGEHYGEGIRSDPLALSVKADPSFIRKSLSKLAKAGLVVTTRGPRQVLGTAVFSGMLGVTLFGLFLTPAFYVALRNVSNRFWRGNVNANSHTDAHSHS